MESTLQAFWELATPYVLIKQRLCASGARDPQSQAAQRPVDSQLGHLQPAHSPDAGNRDSTPPGSSPAQASSPSLLNSGVPAFMADLLPQVCLFACQLIALRHRYHDSRCLACYTFYRCMEVLLFRPGVVQEWISCNAIQSHAGQGVLICVCL